MERWRSTNRHQAYRARTRRRPVKRRHEMHIHHRSPPKATRPNDLRPAGADRPRDTLLYPLVAVAATALRDTAFPDTALPDTALPDTPLPLPGCATVRVGGSIAAMGAGSACIVIGTPEYRDSGGDMHQTQKGSGDPYGRAFRRGRPFRLRPGSPTLRIPGLCRSRPISTPHAPDRAMCGYRIFAQGSEFFCSGTEWSASL